MKRLIFLLLISMIVMQPVVAQTGSVTDIQQTIANIQVRLDNLARQAGSPDSRPSTAAAELSVLRTELDLLCDQVVQVKAALAEVKAQTTAVAEMLADIEILKTENERLQARFQQDAPALASLDDIAAVPQPNRNDATVVSEPTTPPLGLTFAGYVAASGVAQDGTSASNFGLDQAELNVSKSDEGPASLLAEVECVSNGDGGFDVELEQGYVSYAFGASQAVVLSLGKFNSPLGWEAVDAPDMYQYSWATASNFIPGNLTGLLVDVQFAPAVGLSAFVVNGWDVNADNNRDKTVGGRLGFTPSENADLGAGIIYGPEQDDNVASKRMTVDMDFTLTPSANWLLGGELQLGEESKMLEDEGTARWRGGLITSRFTLSDQIGLTLRYDYFDDVHGLQTGTIQQIHGFTLSPSIEPMTGLRLLAEGRYQSSNAASFLSSDGLPEDNHFSFAFGCSYSL